MEQSDIVQSLDKVDTSGPITHTDQALVDIDPGDLKAWELVHSVLTWMGENKTYSYQPAFAALSEESQQTHYAIEKAFYRAMRRPYVQQRWLERADAREQAALSIVYSHWPHILNYQAELARGKVKGCQPRDSDSTAAARFVDEQRKELESKVRSEETGEKRHPAQILLDAYMRPAKLRRTVVTEEIELERPDTSEIIDVTPE